MNPNSSSADVQEDSTEQVETPNSTHTGLNDKKDSSTSIYMPPLNLQRAPWSSNDLTFTQRIDNNFKETARKTEAFQEWLSAKM